MDDSLSFRRLGAHQWPEAMTLAARSFHGEPFAAALFGDAPLQRFANAHRFYRAAQWHESEQQLGAFVDDVLVGLTVSSPEGHCHVCDHVDPASPPTDPGARLDWKFELNTKSAHERQGRHAWMSRVVVDPALQGAGIGRTLVHHTLDSLRAADRAIGVVLECQQHREALYVNCGFTTVGSVADPAGPPDALLMRVDIDPLR